MKSTCLTLAAAVLAIFFCGISARGAHPARFIDPQFAVKVTQDLLYSTAPVRSPNRSTKSLFLDLYQPDGNNAPRLRPGFVAIHGGGLVRGDKRAHENIVELCRELAARGYVCISINYRMRDDAPPTNGDTPLERALSAATEDAGDAVRWLGDNAALYRVDARRIAVGGSSAGATIALRLAYDAEKEKLPIPAVLSWSGELYASTNLIENGEPALFIVHGDNDQSVDVTRAREIATRAHNVSLPYEIYVCEELGHSVPLDRRPGGVSLYKRLAEFLCVNMDLGHLGQRRRPVRVKR